MRGNLILDRYQPLGTAGEGGFGTVQIAWDPRIQRKVAIKTIKLTALDAYRAGLPGAEAVPLDGSSTADRWHGAVPWQDYLDDQARYDSPDSAEGDDEPYRDDGERQDAEGASPASGPAVPVQSPREVAQVTSLAHLPGLDEARTAAMLVDSRIVTVYDFEIRDRTAYLIMEYVEGITLTRLLSDYGDYITLDMVTAVFDSVAGALSAAHEAGVLHLDIKPDNIMVNLQGQVKVTDFGLATLADASGTGTTGGGTIGYMPLEQMRREHLDARTDEWSLASVAYEMLTGENPFKVPGLDAAEAAIEEAELILPSLCWENLDEQVDDVVFYALDPDRDERYDTVADFAEEMDKFLGDAEEGHEQLSLVVADAMGVDDFAEEEDEYEDDEAVESRGRVLLRDRYRGLFDRVLEFVATRPAREDEPDDEAQVYEDYADDEYEEQVEKPRSKRPKANVLASLKRFSRTPSSAAPRLFGALGCGFAAFFALSNISFVSIWLGSSALYVLAAVSALIAILGFASTGAGALVAFCLLGVAIVACGHPVVGTVVLVASVVWWYSFGHEGRAAANVALCVPLLGAVGGACAVPLLSGTALSPLRAAATTAFSCLIALVMGSFGSMSMLGWDAFANWGFAGVDITGNVLALLSRPSTWACVIGWIAASAIISASVARHNRWLSIAGIVVAAAIALISVLAFFGPTPQLIIFTALAAALALTVHAA